MGTSSEFEHTAHILRGKKVITVVTRGVVVKYDLSGSPVGRYRISPFMK